MPINNNITVEKDLTVVAGGTYNLGDLSNLDVNRPFADQVIVLYYFNSFTDGTLVSNVKFDNWYDPYLLPDAVGGTNVLTFNEANYTVSVNTTQTTGVLGTVTASNGTVYTRPTHSTSNGTKIRVIRAQDVSTRSHVFAPGTRITSDSLNNSTGQVFESIVELNERLVNVEGGTFEGTQGLTDLNDVPADVLEESEVKILQYNPASTPKFEWIATPGSGLTSTGDMTGVDITAGDGMDISQSNTTSGNYTATISADLKANGGIEIQSTELALNLGASSISGVTTVANGGTGANTAAGARTALGITNVGAYTGQIEAVSNKTYTIDPGAATARNITGFYIKSASGTVTATLKVGTDVVKAASVSSSSGDQTSLANTDVAVNEVITIVTTSNSSATDVIFSVEYTE